MMALERGAAPLARCMRSTRHNRIIARGISTSAARQQETTTEPPSSAEPPPPSPPPAEAEASTPKHKLNPKKVSTPRTEGRLKRLQNQTPIGSRRRRAALASSSGIPFVQLPYQCFQEARKILNDDRAEKVAEIEQLRGKIAKLTAQDVPPEKERRREEKIGSWSKEIERLKILADINDPLVKKKFEDGFGDLNKPIYRHLSNLKWRNNKRQILMQRIYQMSVVPDVLPGIDPTVSTNLIFNRSKIPHGEFVLAGTSERPPKMEIQSYEKGKKLVSIAVVTPDVPNVEKDGFDYRCHFLAANVPISPTRPWVDLGKLSKDKNVIQEWFPPYSQKGAPYQRLAVVIMEQPSAMPAAGAAAADPLAELENAEMAASDAAATLKASSGSPAAATEAAVAATTPAVPETAPSEAAPSPERATPGSPQPVSTTTSSLAPIDPLPQPLDVATIKRDPRYTTRADFRLKSFYIKYNLRPIGIDLFRTQWDETTADVMRRNGIVGHDVEFKRKRVEPLPYQRLKGERYR